MKNKSIGIIGHGFVGGAVSQLKDCFDVSIYDPNQKEYEDNVEAFRSDIVFVCVPTLESKTGKLDTSIVEATAERWAANDPGDSILVVKSTIPPGTIEKLNKKLKTKNIVHNPEFLTERTAKEDFRNPKEVIVGGEDSACEAVLSLYKEYYKEKDIQYFNVSAKSAEMIKMTRNSFYALKVAFFNEVYDLCEAVGEDYNEFKNVFTLNGKHPWVGNQHVSVPGPDGRFGFGGKCLPKDSKGLLKFAEEHDIIMKTLKACISSNELRRGSKD